jgi:hypothetical protein
MDLRVCVCSWSNLDCLNANELDCLMFFFCILQLTAVHLIDGHLCCDPGKYVSALLLSLSTMLHMELPHINVLSKIDLIENYGNLGIVPSIFLSFERLLVLVEFDVHTIFY